MVEASKSDGSEINSETGETKRETNETSPSTAIYSLTQNEQAVLTILQSYPHVTQKTLSGKTGLSLSTIKRIMSALQEKGIARRKGSNRNGEWEILIPKVR